EQPDATPARDAPQGSLRVVIGHGQTAVVEEAPQGVLLADGVAERGGDQTARVLDARVLRSGPDEEVVDERTQDELSSRVSLRGGEMSPLFFEVEELAHAQQGFAR